MDKNTHVTVSMRRKISGLLIALFSLVIIIALVAFFFPLLWFKIFHDAPYIDPQGLLPRCGANWLAFALVQTLALLRWEKKPYWLAIVAGVRLSDVFTDWAYLMSCSSITVFGGISLILMSPLNLLFGIYFLTTYKKIAKERQR